MVHRDVICVARRAVSIERHDDGAGVQPRPDVRRHDAWVPGVRPVLQRRVVDARRRGAQAARRALQLFFALFAEAVVAAIGQAEDVQSFRS